MLPLWLTSDVLEPIWQGPNSVESMTLYFLAEVSDATLGGFKTAGVVIVALAFVGIVIRSLGSRESTMKRGASMALDDGKPADQVISKDN